MAAQSLQLIPQGRVQWTDANGNPLIGGSVYSYVPGTTTPQNTYADPAGATLNPNPITLDARGEATMWGSGTYRQMVYDALGDLIWDVETVAQDFAGTNGAAAIGFLQAGANAVARTVQSKLQETVSVLDFGAVGSPNDDSGAFQAAVNALPAAGGRVLVPAMAFVINSAPSWGAKSIFWDISPGASFSGTGVGTGLFPYMTTNTGQLAVGPFIQSKSPQVSATANGGIAALSVEMLQPATYIGQSVAGYFGASGSNANTSANVWAINALISANAGATGTYQGIEVDVNCNSASATVKGISINGIGSSNPFSGLEVIRSDTTLWQKGIHVLDSITGIHVEDTTGLVAGIQLGGGLLGTAGMVVGQQFANGGDCILIARATDTSSTGSFLRFVNNADNSNLFRVDTNGNVSFAGSLIAGGNEQASSYVSAQNVQLTGGAVSMPAGQICIGNTVAGTANAGSATLPSNPVGFLDFFIGPTVYKIPYYNN